MSHTEYPDISKDVLNGRRKVGGDELVPEGRRRGMKYGWMVLGKIRWRWR